MREIKFRAWEKNLKEIIPVENVDFVVKQINVNSAWRMFGEIELMQYTGLKDKNGKEIYEGDIIRVSDRLPQAVTFDEGFFQTDEFALFELTRNKERTFEVIGNIYENPELLETAK